jgi:hypothetical protein
MIHSLVPLVDPASTDNVRPGWIPLLIVIALGAFIAFLYFSMKKQLGRINFPDDEPAEGSDENGGATPPAPV